MSCQLIDIASFWTIVGVVLGFGLGEVSRLVRRAVRVGRLKRLLRDELVSIRSQIPLKRQILSNMIGALNQRKVLPGVSVSAVSIGYRQHIGEVYEHLSLLERNCLHVIHEHLRVSDHTMNSFLDDFQAMTRDKVIDDPFGAFKILFGEIDKSYQTVERLISSYLDNKPMDVFGAGTERATTSGTA